MKGRECKAAPSADLLVCFPSRAHLTLMPKPICSPARPSEPTKRHHNHHHHHHHHSLLKKSSTRSGGGGGSLASPLLWNKNKQMGSEISEPTSPKVTCAGQIKVRPKTSTCKNWKSVMEEIERIHNGRKNKKKHSWVESFGFKKEIMQFLTCLRSIRLDFRCFGAFRRTDISTDEEDEEEDDEQYQRNLNDHLGNDGNEASRPVFSKWFMVLQENQKNGFCNERKAEKESSHYSTDVQPAIPPPNALLLMRCRSAPEKSRLEEKEEDRENKGEAEEEEEEEEELGKKCETRKNLRTLMDEEKKSKKKDETCDFYKISSDIAKETWLVGGTQDPLSRSRSWKR